MCGSRDGRRGALQPVTGIVSAHSYLVVELLACIAVKREPEYCGESNGRPLGRTTDVGRSRRTWWIMGMLKGKRGSGELWIVCWWLGWEVQM